MDTSFYSRRAFISTLTSGIGTATLSFTGLASLAGCGQSQKNYSPDEAVVKGGLDVHKLGIALVGLGGYSSGQLAPALQQTAHCYLGGIVTGTADKEEKWSKKYNIPSKNIYNYQNFDSIKDNPDIDIVYVVLPNAMHKEFVIRAAQAGKHVICEKPMAVTVEDCDAMIKACKQAGKMLSIGYRLHFEPHNLEMMRLGKDKAFGNIKYMTAEDGMSDTSGWRLNKALAGGGPLMDLGIYCVQGVRYTTGTEPIAVTAIEGPKHDLEKFKEVEESLSWKMEMPGGIVANCKASYSEKLNVLRADAEQGWFELKPSYEYKGIKGETVNGKMNFPEVNQQALQMDDFAQAIKSGRATPVPGEMGRQDVKILQAIYESMRTGKRVSLG